MKGTAYFVSLQPNRML